MRGVDALQEKAFWLFVTVMESYGLRELYVAAIYASEQLLLTNAGVSYWRALLALPSTSLHPQSSTLFDTLRELDRAMELQLPNLRRHLVRTQACCRQASSRQPMADVLPRLSTRWVPYRSARSSSSAFRPCTQWSASPASMSRACLSPRSSGYAAACCRW